MTKLDDIGKKYGTKFKYNADQNPESKYMIVEAGMRECAVAVVDLNSGILTGYYQGDTFLNAPVVVLDA